MACRVASRCASRFLSEFTSTAKAAGGRGTSRNYWTYLKTSSTPTGGRVACLLGLSVFSCLGYSAYCRVQSSAVVHALDKDAVVEQADYLYSCAEIEKLYQLLVQYKESDDARFLWRLARAARNLALLPETDAGQKKQLIFDAFEYASKALEKDDKCFAAHKWYAVCLGDVGDYRGTKEKLASSVVIRGHLEEAVKLNPKDATSFHILGYWCFAFAELPWYQRKLAAVIFSKPPESTYEEALDFFLKAEEADPDFYSKNMLMLGKTYMALKDKEKALLWLTKARDYPARTWEDKEVHQEAVDLLKKLR